MTAPRVSRVLRRNAAGIMSWDSGSGDVFARDGRLVWVGLRNDLRLIAVATEPEPAQQILRHIG